MTEEELVLYEAYQEAELQEQYVSQKAEWIEEYGDSVESIEEFETSFEDFVEMLGQGDVDDFDDVFIDEG